MPPPVTTVRRTRNHSDLQDQRTPPNDEMMQYLQGLATSLDRKHSNGTPFRLSEKLPSSHPAREFARNLNRQSGS